MSAIECFAELKMIDDITIDTDVALNSIELDLSALINSIEWII